MNKKNTSHFSQIRQFKKRERESETWSAVLTKNKRLKSTRPAFFLRFIYFAQHMCSRKNEIKRNRIQHSLIIHIRFLFLIVLVLLHWYNSGGIKQLFAMQNIKEQHCKSINEKILYLLKTLYVLLCILLVTFWYVK